MIVIIIVASRRLLIISYITYLFTTIMLVNRWCSCSSLILKTNSPSNKAHMLLFPCNALLAEKCFATLFDQMPDICINSEPSLRCHHFTYLDQCLEGVGECTAYTIGNAAKLAYQTRLTDCRLRTDQLMMSPELLMSSQQQHLHRLSSSLNSHHFVALIGYLQSQCEMPYRNCTLMDAYSDVFDSCEREIRERAIASQSSDYDRHQILRIKVDASRKLLDYAETRRDEECLIIRSALTDLHLLHYKHCLRSTVTRCLCERAQLTRLCDIDCTQLQATSGDDHRLGWTNFRGRLVSNDCVTCGGATRLIITSLLIQLLFHNSDIIITNRRSYRHE